MIGSLFFSVDTAAFIFFLSFLYLPVASASLDGVMSARERRLAIVAIGLHAAYYYALLFYWLIIRQDF